MTSFVALDSAQQKALLSSKLLTEEQKTQCITMTALSNANMKYTADQLSRISGVSTEMLANIGLTKSTDALAMSELAEMAISDKQAEIVLKKVIAQNAQDVANGKVTASNIALASSEKALSIATGSVTTAIKANVRAIWTWMTTTPIGMFTSLAVAVFSAVKAYDALTTSVKEQKEKIKDSLSEYKDVKSELSNITSELENQKKVLDDLLKKEKLTYAEQGQLEELQAITNELRIQKDLLEKEETKSKEQLARDTSDLFNKQFGGYEISEDAIRKYSTNSRDALALTSEEDNISAMIAGYKRVLELREEANKSGSLEDIDYYKSWSNELYDFIFSKAKDLQEQQDNISDYYQIIKDTPYNELTKEQQEIVDSYNSISDAIQLIYQQLDPHTWNSIQIENIFNTKGIEKTKDELVEMAKTGELSPNTFKSYKNLNNALLETTLTADDLYNELMAIADSEKIVGDSPIFEEVFSLEEKDVKALSDYQSKIDSISKSLGNLYNLEAGDITKIMGDFEAYDSVFEKWGVTGEKGVGNLKAALEEIATSLKDTATTAVPQMTEAIEEMFQIIMNPKGSIDKFSSEIEELETVLEKARAGENIDGIETLINKYGDLEGSVIKLNDGYSLEEDAIISLLNTRIESYNSAIAYDAEYTKQCIDNIEKRAEAMFKVEAGALRAIADVRRTNSEYTTRVYAKQKYGIDDTRFNLALKEGIALNELYKEYEELLEKIKTPFEKNDDKADKNNTIDWMTTSLANLQEKVDDANRKLENTNGLEAQKEAIKELNAELGNLKKAYIFVSDEYNTRYKNALYSLSKYDVDKDDIQSKIEAGFIFDTDSFPSEVAELINDAIDAWNGKRDADNKVIELGYDIQDNNEQIPDIIMEHFDRQLAMFESQANMIESKLANAESRGLIATQEFYKSLKGIETDKIGLKKDELESLQTIFDEGKLEEGSDAWYDLKENIEEVKLEIQEAENAIVDFDNKMRQVDWDMFDFARDQESQLMGEADFMIDLLDSAKLFSDAGEMTAEGLATMGLHAQNYNAYLEQSIAYAEEYKRIQEDIAKDPYNTQLIERRNELLELQQESILSAESEKDSMIDLVTEGIELQKDAFQDLIDKYTEALDIQKDLYDYQKRNSEQTKKIASIQKQLASYSGDSSDEARAKVQQLKVQLDEEQGNLEEQQYSRYIDDQKEILGTIYENYESALDSYLDNVVKVIADSIATVNAGTSEINDTIKDKVESVGYELSEKIENIWSKTSVFKEGFKGVKDSVDDERGILSDFRLENTELITAQKDAITTALQNLLTQEGISNLTEDNIKNDTSDIRSGVYTANGWLETIAKNTTPTLNSTNTPGVVMSSSGSDNGVIYASNGNVYKPLPSDNKSIVSNKSGMFTSTPTTVQTILKDSAYVPTAVVKTNSVGSTIGEVNNKIEINCPNVTDYNSLVKQLQADKKFEKVIVDITSSALTGSSSLSKYRHQLK